MTEKSLAEDVSQVSCLVKNDLFLLFCRAFIKLRVNNGHLQFQQSTVTIYILTIVIVDRDFNFQNTLKTK